MTTYAAEVLADNPIRYYHLEEVSGTAAADASTSGVAGTYSGTGGPGAFSTTGVVGNGMAFTAVGNASVTCTLPTLTSAFSIEYWFKGPASTGAVKWRDATTSNGWLMMFANANADITLRINGTNRTITGLGTTLTDGSWHHLVVTSSGTQAITYLDGAAVDTWSVTAAASTINTSMRLNKNGTASTYYDGKYDEWAMYSAVLSPTRVLAHFNATVTPGVPTSLASTGPTGTTLTLTWSPPASGGLVSSYEARINGGAPVTATSPHTFTGLSPGTTYTLEVRAVGPGGTSAYASLSADTALAAPGVPTAVTLGTVGYTTAELSWGAPATGGAVASYQVRVDGGAPVTATSPHTFTGLSPGTTYTLEVRAVNAGGESAWVAVTADTTPVPPGFYVAELAVGPLSWTVEHGVCDPSGFGPVLPLSLGWSMPDTVEFFPCQSDQTTMTFSLLVEDANDVQDVVKGSTVTFAMWVSPDPSAEPWQTFSGVVTQLDGEQVPDGFKVTVYATDDTARLAGYVVGYSGDWPQENASDRLDRIATEAGINIDTVAGTGLGGVLAARPASPLDALSAIRATLKDAAAQDSSTLAGTDYWGRPLFWYVRDDDSVAWDATAAADTTLVVRAIYRRVPGEWQDPPAPVQLELDGCQVNATGRWSKLPGPDGRSWVIVDGATFGTPSGPPLVRNTSLVDITPGFNPSAVARDQLGNSLLPDGSTMLSGWYARSLRYQAHAAPDPLGPMFPLGPGIASWAPLTDVIPVVVVDVLPAYDLEDVGYLAGTLTGARMTIPPGGAFYVDLRLRPELLPGMELPA